METNNNMQNSIFGRFELKESNVFEKHTEVVPGSISMFSREDEKYIHRINVFECNGEYGLYKALKVVLRINNKFQELTPWPVLDYQSAKMCEHTQEIQPMFVRFYEARNLETGEINNRVRILPFATPADYEAAKEAWNNRP